MLKKEWAWMYFNDEWNKEPDDDEAAYEDGVDERPEPTETEYNDDEYDY